MEKIAADDKLGSQDLQKIAAFGCATTLASPVVGLNPEQVKKATDAFMGGMQKAAARHDKIVDMIRSYVKGPGTASA